MTNDTPDLQGILRRIETLERQNRRLRGAWLLALILVPTLVVVSQCRPMVAGRIVANDIVVNDSKGHKMAELTVEPDTVWGDQATLRFWSSSGQLESKLSQGSLSLGIEGVTDTANLGIDGLSVYPRSSDKNALPSLTLGTDIASIPSLRMWRGQNQHTPELSLTVENGEPVIALSDAAGFATTIGSTDLVTTRTGETHKTSAASVVLFGKDSKVLWSAP